MTILENCSHLLYFCLTDRRKHDQALLGFIYLLATPMAVFPNSMVHSWFLRALINVMSNKRTQLNINMQASQIQLDGLKSIIFRMLQDALLNNLQSEKSSADFSMKLQSSSSKLYHIAKLYHLRGGVMVKW